MSPWSEPKRLAAEVIAYTRRCVELLVELDVEDRGPDASLLDLEVVQSSVRQQRTGSGMARQAGEDLVMVDAHAQGALRCTLGQEEQARDTALHVSLARRFTVAA